MVDRNSFGKTGRAFLPRSSAVLFCLLLCLVFFSICLPLSAGASKDGLNSPLTLTGSDGSVTGFTDLPSALAAASSGDKITLHDSFTLSDINTDLPVEVGDDAELTLVSGSLGQVTLSGGHLTIAGGSIDSLTGKDGTLLWKGGEIRTLSGSFSSVTLGDGINPFSATLPPDTSVEAALFLLSNKAALTLDGNATLTAGQILMKEASSLTNRGRITGQIAVNGSCTLFNAPGAVWEGSVTVAEGAAVTFTNNGYLSSVDNAGMLTLTGSGWLTTALNNSGTVILGGLVEKTCVLTNTGSMTLNTTVHGLTSSGVLIVGAGGAVVGSVSDILVSGQMTVRLGGQIEALLVPRDEALTLTVADGGVLSKLVCEGSLLLKDSPIAGEWEITESGQLTLKGIIRQNGHLVADGEILLGDRAHLVRESGEILLRKGSLNLGNGSVTGSGSFLVTIAWDTDGDGVTDDTSTCPYGGIPSHEEGKKNFIEGISYVFESWSPEPVPADATAVYSAVFSEEKWLIPIHWDLNGDGTVDETTMYQYGEKPVHAIPVKEESAQYVYHFVGWNREFTPATEEATYRAVFSHQLQTYLIGWDFDGDGNVDTASMMDYGTIPVPPETPFREDTAQYTYTFLGWDTPITPVSGSQLYTAVFDGQLKNYTVYWDTDGDGTAEIIEQIPFGTYPTTPEPGRNPDDKFKYNFDVWSPTVAPVTSDVFYSAQFTHETDSGSTPRGTPAQITVMNMTGEAQNLLIQFFYGGKCQAAKPISLEDGATTTVYFSDLIRPLYTFLIGNWDHSGSFNIQSVSTSDKDQLLLTAILSQKSAAVDFEISENCYVSTLKLPMSQIDGTATTEAWGFTEDELDSSLSKSLRAVLTAYSDTVAPFRETLLAMTGGKTTIGMFFSLSLNKSVGEMKSQIDWSRENMELVMELPENLREQILDGGSEICFYRVLNGRQDTITREPNIYGEHFEVDEDLNLLTLYIRSPGYFALAYVAKTSFIPMWWMALLFDLVAAWLLFVDKRFRGTDYSFKILSGLLLSAIMILVLVLHPGVWEIIFSTVGWIFFAMILLNNDGKAKERVEEIPRLFEDEPEEERQPVKLPEHIDNIFWESYIDTQSDKTPDQTSETDDPKNNSGQA